MAQRVIVQDGIVQYASSDPATLDINFSVAGVANVTKQVNVGDDILAPGLISTPTGSGVDLIFRTETNGLTNGNIKFEPVVGGSILLNNIAWPNGAVSPVPGMYLGVSALNTLQFYTLPTLSGLISINTQPGNYTLQLSDAVNTLVRMTSAVPANLTIENDGVINMPIGSAVLIGQNGAGTITVVAAGGVTIVSPDSLVIGKQYGKITAIKTAANYWEIEGNLAP